MHEETKKEHVNSKNALKVYEIIEGIKLSGRIYVKTSIGECKQEILRKPLAISKKHWGQLKRSGEKLLIGDEERVGLFLFSKSVFAEGDLICEYAGVIELLDK